MSEISSALSTSRGKKKALDFAIAIGIGEILGSFIPGFNIFTYISIVIDMVDPYNYKYALTRKSIDKMSKDARESLDALQNNADIQSGVEQLAKQYGLTDQKDLLLQEITSHWKLYKPAPEKLNACYSDAPFSFTGKPTEDCNNVYRFAYDKYSKENKQIYIDNNIKDNSFKIGKIRDITFALKLRDAENERDHFLTPILIGIITIFTLAVLIVAAHFIFKYFIYKT